MSAVETIEIPVGDMTFTARAAGPEGGRLVLLLHGFPQTSYEWREQLTALGEAGYRAIAPDQRGYSPGARPEGVDHYVMDLLVADVMGIVDTLGLDQFDLVGHDWGAAVAWHVAGRYPERVRTLTIVSVPHPRAFADALSGKLGGDQPERSSYVEFFRSDAAEPTFLANDAAMLRQIFTSSGISDADADEYARVLTQPGALTGALNWYRATNFTDQPEVGPITSPTLFVWSTNDMALGREGAEATAAHVDGPYRFEVFEGVTHWVPDTAGAELNRVLLEHLSATA
jgi:pimeloyl-ACP methyl ester carboxylesterase